jgi:hypothetical protein
MPQHSEAGRSRLRSRKSQVINGPSYDVQLSRLFLHRPVFGHTCHPPPAGSLLNVAAAGGGIGGTGGMAAAFGRADHHWRSSNPNQLTFRQA